MRTRKTKTVTDQDERLPAEMARRNWIILGILLLVSLCWRSRPVTMGVFGGGMIAIVGFHWMHRSLREALSGSEPGAARRFQMTYFIRLGALAAAIAVLIVPAKVHPAALAAGLSVVVLNILWTTFKRSI